MPLILTSDNAPGWQIDPGPGVLVPVTCPVEPLDHLHLRRDWDAADWTEPARPQRPILRRAEVLDVNGFGAFLFRPRVLEAMTAAGLTGWASVPARVHRRDGTVDADWREFRVTAVAGMAGPEAGMAMTGRCRVCGGTRYDGKWSFRIDRAAELVDPGGPDFQMVWPVTGLVFVSPRVKPVLSRFGTDTLVHEDSSRRCRPLPGDGGPFPPWIDDSWHRKVEALLAALPRWPD
jgi:hypothetical protein